MTSCAEEDALPDGVYRARAHRSGVGKVEFSGGVVLHYVWISFSLLDGLHRGRLFEWRGWITRGGLFETVPALIACGARLENNDPSDLRDVDMHVVDLSLKTIDCVEAPGVVKTYISDVKRSDPL